MGAAKKAPAKAVDSKDKLKKSNTDAAAYKCAKCMQVRAVLYSP